MLLKERRSSGLNLREHQALPQRYKGALSKKLYSQSQLVDDGTWVSICGPTPGQKREEQLCSFVEKMYVSL